MLASVADARNVLLLCPLCIVAMITCGLAAATPMTAGGDDDADTVEVSHRARSRIIERLFRSEAAGLARYLRSRIGRHEDVHDLVQDAFARLATARPAVLSDRPEAYLQRIARNILYDRFRSNKIRLVDLHVPVEEARSVSTPAEQGWAIEGDDATKRYLAALDELPPRTREVFLLNRVDGLTYQEVAVRFGVSGKAIEYHMTRALAHLHRTFYGE